MASGQLTFVVIEPPNSHVTHCAFKLPNELDVYLVLPAVTELESENYARLSTSIDLTYGQNRNLLFTKPEHGMFWLS